MNTSLVVPSGRVSSGLVARGLARDALVRHVPERNARIADAGCGSGEFLRQLRDAGYRNLVGCDRNAYPNFPRDASSFVAVDVSCDPLPFPDASVDALTAWEVFEHLENPFFFAREAHRALKPGGLFLFSMPNLLHLENRLLFFRTGNFWRWNKKNDHRIIFTPDIFQKTFVQRGFVPLETRYPFALLGKHGILGRVQRRLRFLRRFLPENEWFGYFILFVLKKHAA